MSPAQTSVERRDRLEELLLLRALEGIDTEASRELDALLYEFPDVLDDEYDLLAARLDAEWCAGHDTSREVLSDDLRARLLARGLADRHVSARRAAPRRLRRAVPWLVAAASIAAAFYLGRGIPAAAPLTASALRAELLETDAGVLEIRFSPGEDANAQNLSGEIVWRGDLQQGVMHFRGLAANDPTREQYQLWIFDRSGDERHPVDGGVFDIAEGDDAEAWVVVDAKIRVRDPYLFAVTVERPGGVVVSSRERIVALGEVP